MTQNGQTNHFHRIFKFSKQIVKKNISAPNFWFKAYVDMEMRCVIHHASSKLCKFYSGASKWVWRHGWLPCRDHWLLGERGCQPKRLVRQVYVSTLNCSTLRLSPILTIRLKLKTHFVILLSDPGVPGVRSMGPDVTTYNTICRLNWCDSGWWG